MKMKRIVARDMRTAIKKVREELGADAVILANRKVEEGVEIVAALDYDEEKIYERCEPEKKPEKYHHPEEHSKHPQTSFQSSVRPESTRLAGSEYAQMARDALTESQQNSHDEAGHFSDTNATNVKLSRQSQASSLLAHFQTETIAAPPDRYSQPPPQHSSARSQEHRSTKSSAYDPNADYFQEPEPARHARQPRGSQPVRQEALIDNLQHEVSSLRGLMENQLAVLEWDGISRRHPVRVSLLNRLADMGLGIDLAMDIANEVSETQDIDRAWRLALEILSQKIPVMDDEILNQGGVIALVGSTGVGKTTTVAKLAARFAMMHGQRNVAIVTTDNYRIGAHEQLLHYARILGVPMHTADNHEELGRVLVGLMDRKLVLVDTAGMSQRDLRLNEQFATLRGSSPLIKSYLVMSASTDLNALDETIKAFSRVDLTGCIITKLDEATTIGASVTAAIRNDLPVAYIGVGQRVPEDLQPARANRLISRALSNGQNREDEELDPDMLAVKLRGASNNAHV